MTADAEERKELAIRLQLEFFHRFGSNMKKWFVSPRKSDSSQSSAWHYVMDDDVLVLTVYGLCGYFMILSYSWYPYKAGPQKVVRRKKLDPVTMALMSDYPMLLNFPFQQGKWMPSGFEFPGVLPPASSKA
ncbi:hypothetical protein DFH07DRAFT_766951 [Mycena maculata]|uniref:Uncharacterized protein n=1 Tax=Mycena maculata TaxID=230809 RepID=A0AAD7K134_9AGAR|nr:hypothetical protein DFH07DRAFT_766951 [Mycena maculata]